VEETGITRGDVLIALAGGALFVGAVAYWVAVGDPGTLPVPTSFLRWIVPCFSLMGVIGFSVFLVDAAESPSNSPIPWVAALGTLLALLLVYAAAFKATGLRDVNCNEKIESCSSITHDGFDAFYFAVVTWTTLGFGDFVPSTRTGRGLAACEAMTGYLMMGAFLVAFTNRVRAVHYSVRKGEKEMSSPMSAPLVQSGQRQWTGDQTGVLGGVLLWIVTLAVLRLAVRRHSNEVE
jgi:Ion channel